MRRGIQGAVAGGAALLMGLLTACGNQTVGASSHPALVRTDDPESTPTEQPSPSPTPSRGPRVPPGTCDVVGCGEGHCIDWCGSCDDCDLVTTTEIVEPDDVTIQLEASRDGEGRRLDVRVSATAVLTNGCQSAGALLLASTHGDGPDVEPNLTIWVRGYERQERQGPNVVCTADVRSEPINALHPFGNVEARSWQLDLGVRLRSVSNAFSLEQDGYAFTLSTLDARNARLASGSEVQELIAYPLDVGRVYLGSGTAQPLPGQPDTEPARPGDSCQPNHDGERAAELRAHASGRGWADPADEYGFEGARGPNEILAVVRDRVVPFDAEAPEDGALVVGHLADGAPVCLVGLP